MMNEISVKDLEQKWERVELNALNLFTMRQEFERDLPMFIGTDTETDSLNVITGKPFDLIFGWITPTRDIVFYGFIEELPELLSEYQKMINNQCYKWHFAWNATFDANMLLNVGVDITDRLADGQALLRLFSTCDDEHERKALKKVAVKYIASDADTYEKEVKAYLREDKAKWTREMKKFIYGDWNYASVKAALKAEEYIPDDVMNAWDKYCEEHPEPNYKSIPKEVIHRYAPLDVILMMEIVKKLYPSINNIKSPLYQKNIFETECAVIPAIIEQIRTGWLVDMDYLEASRKRLRSTIDEYQERLDKVLGQHLTVGQDKELGKWLAEQGWKFPMVEKKLAAGIVQVPDYKSNKELLSKIIDFFGSMPQEKIDALTPEQQARRIKILTMCDIVVPLRTYEKWYSTYITKIIKNVKDHKDGHFHPSYDAYGAVSGRFTSDSQQFPRQGCYDAEGNELFNPRKAMLAPKGYWILYLDYSQIELRLGGHFTIVAGHPEPNILNAYMNYFNDPNWKKTDMHLAMAINAFELTPEEISCYERMDAGEELAKEELKIAKRVKENRSVSKSANFAFLYGGTYRAINKSLFEDKNEELAKKLEQAFFKTYPGFRNYQEWVKKEVEAHGRISNALGRIYRYAEPLPHSIKSSTGKYSYVNPGKTAANYIIQGTGADFLKGRMAECYKTIREKNWDVKMIGNIHDELQFLVPEGRNDIVKELKHIMESGAEFSEVPIIADVEITSTNWAAKTNWKGGE